MHNWLQSWCWIEANIPTCIYKKMESYQWTNKSRTGTYYFATCSEVATVYHSLHQATDPLDWSRKLQNSKFQFSIYLFIDIYNYWMRTFIIKMELYLQCSFFFFFVRAFFLGEDSTFWRMFTYNCCNRMI